MADDVSVLQYRNLNPNGLKISHGALYVSADPILEIGTSQLIRYRLAHDRLTDPQVIYQAVATFDDFALLSRRGIALAESLWGSVVEIDEDTGSIRHAFASELPTSVHVIVPDSVSGSPGESLIMVTERSANQVEILSNTWSLAPRE